MTARARVVLGVVAAFALSACTSPEASRLRAGGPGGDVGNRRDVVLMHEGADPYWKTPRTPGIAGPSLDPARQAARLSER